MHCNDDVKDQQGTHSICSLDCFDLATAVSHPIRPILVSNVVAEELDVLLKKRMDGDVGHGIISLYLCESLGRALRVPILFLINNLSEEISSIQCIKMVLELLRLAWIQRC